MQLFVIGPEGRGRRPQNIGVLLEKERPEERVEKLQPHIPGDRLVVHRAAPLDKGLDTLAFRIITYDLGDALARSNGWYDVHRDRATLAFDKAIRALGLIGEDLPAPNFAAFVRYVRLGVFACSQPVFGKIAGGVVAASVSRWEAGENMPNTLQINRMKRFAEVAGLPWDDEWLANPPEIPAASAAA